jgi:hypothetical protein
MCPPVCVSFCALVNVCRLCFIQDPVAAFVFCFLDQDLHAHGFIVLLCLAAVGVFHFTAPILVIVKMLFVTRQEKNSFFSCSQTVRTDDVS